MAFVNREVYTDEVGRWRYPGNEGIPCVECGERVLLYWNGGELDEAICCGIGYVGEYVRVDVVALKKPTQKAASIIKEDSDV